MGPYDQVWCPAGLLSGASLNQVKSNICPRHFTHPGLRFYWSHVSTDHMSGRISFTKWSNNFTDTKLLIVANLHCYFQFTPILVSLFSTTCLALSSADTCPALPFEVKTPFWLSIGCISELSKNFRRTDPCNSSALSYSPVFMTEIILYKSSITKIHASLPSPFHSLKTSQLKL